MFIQSKNNEMVKKAVKLKDKKYRYEYGQFLVENEKILIEAYKNNYVIHSIFYCLPLQNDYGGQVNYIETTQEVLKHLSSTSSPAKCVAVVNMKGSESLAKEYNACEEGSHAEGLRQKGCKALNKNLSINSNFLVLDRLQDPSNVGAIIRSSLGANFTNVLLIDCADIYDTKVIRSSMGAVFNLNVQKVGLEDVKKLNFPLVVLDMKGQNIFKEEFNKGQIYGFIVGNEGQGVCDELKKVASKTVAIPMNERLESLNASVSASLVMYAISRGLKESL